MRNQAENNRQCNRKIHDITKNSITGKIILRKRRIPPMLADIVQATLASCDGVLFDSRETCPQCGGELAGYDVKKKQFAVLIEGDQKKVIHVRVKRFRCRGCREICFAHQPFYPDTRIGSPVVDLCVTLGETMHIPRVSSCLREMGIVVDRWSVRNYIQKNCHPVPAADMFGVRVPLSVFSLSSLAVGIPEGCCIDASGLLAACGYPSRKKSSDRLPSRDQISDPE
jgi:hypothetical protein